MIVIPVPLWRDGKVIAHALISPEDAEGVLPYRWFLHVSAGGYAARSVHQRPHVLLHRQLMGCVPGDGLIVDHRDRDRLNDVRSNLRITDQSGNQQNQPLTYVKDGVLRHRNVRQRPKDGRWLAKVELHKKQHYLGTFPTEQDAVAVVAAWRAEHMPFSEVAG